MRRTWTSYLAGIGLGLAGLLCVIRSSRGAEPAPACTLENQHLKYVVGADGSSLQWIDKRDGANYCPASRPPFALVSKAGQFHRASSVRQTNGLLNVEFGKSGARAVIKATALPQYLLLEVVSLSGDGVDQFVFAEVPLTLKAAPEERFVACALALNLQTNVAQLPRPTNHLRAVCYAKFGFPGAKVALIGCPAEKLREAMQQAVSAAHELPHSPLGGPWALGQPINQGSYLFNFGNMSEDKADDWIQLAKRLGMNQIDFHGGGSFRFGDCRPNPVTYPRGFDSFKAVIDKLHAAGIKAGLHTYAFFIAKSCPWVTPIPDPRLAKDATFTLSAPLTDKSDAVPVVESTEKMSTITGFFVRNSVTLQIDDELITYSGVSKEAPYAFTGCRRGACGTRVAPHAAGAKVHHLKECFGLFVPDPETTLLAEVAAKTAEAYNRCGFDMMYLDALDGEDTLGGRENSWHYGSKFVFEICRRLNKPALMEMSTFHHHLWFVRSRYCAWDHPNRGHKQFIDLHLRDNLNNRRMFMPGEFGWWALKSWSGTAGEPTFADDIEYLMGKCLGTDTGMAMMGIDPSSVSKVPALPRLAEIIRRYEDLRHSGRVPEPIKARLATAGQEFTLIGDLASGFQFRPVQYAKHKVESGEWSRTWRTTNKFGVQPVRLRIEALLAAKPYDAPGNATLAEFTSDAEFPRRAAAGRVTAALQPSQVQTKAAATSGCYTATNAGPTATGAWTKMEKQFSPTIGLKGRQALGLWVHGDGQQEVLNLQLRSPNHISHGIEERYIPIDFTGWRYFELVEPEGERYGDYVWPYGGIYAMYRELANFAHLDTLGLWYNNLPPGKKVTCYLSPVKALPLTPTRLIRPALTIGQKTIVFPVEMESGGYLEFNSAVDCKLYGPQGQLIREVKPEGDVPTLAAGENEVRFQCGTPPNVSARANVTVISQGEPL